MDKDKIKKAVSLFLEGIGEDPEREGLLETPDRIAKMCEELFGGYEADAAGHLEKTFTSTQKGLVLEKDITFYSVCEHHLLPFYGKVHIGYIPDGKVVGLSKLARTVEVFASRAQIQEQLTDQIADAMMDILAPKGVIVMVEAEHMCMTMRGIKKPGTKTITLSTRGCAKEEEAGIFGTTAVLICYENVPSGKNEGNYDARRKENDRKYENWKPNLYIWKKSIYHGNFKRDTGFLFGRWKV